MRITMILALRAWDNLVARLTEMGNGAADTLVSLLLALLVALVGWGVAAVVAWAARTLLRAARFNQGVRGLFGGSPIRHEPAGLAAWAIYWTIVVTALMLAIDSMGFSLGASVSARLADVLPRIVAAGVLFAIGVFVAMVLGALARRFFETAGLRASRLRGQAVTAVVSAFTVLLALEQLGFAAQFIMAIGLISLGALGLALGLAFGLGCRDLARDFVVEYLRSMDEQGTQRPS